MRAVPWHGATYMGIAEKAWFAALRNAVAALHDDERVLELDPKYVDAKVLVGTDLTGATKVTVISVNNSTK